MNYFGLLVICGVTFYICNTNSLINSTQITTSNLKPICSICKCNLSASILDCSKCNVENGFTNDVWKSNLYNKSDFEIVLFENNNLSSIESFANLTIKRLSLKDNAIEKIENAAFMNLHFLETLDLSHNLLSSQSLLHHVFRGSYSPFLYEPLTALKELNLAFNNLHSLQSNTFEHIPELESLILSHNNFKVIDTITETCIASLANLKYLDLSYMEISILPEFMLHAPRKLEILDLSGNLFTNIPIGLTYAFNLKELCLDDNPLNNLDGINIMPKMENLNILNMSYIPTLTVISEGAFSNLRKLNILRLTNNSHLTYIHNNAFVKLHENKTLQYYVPIQELYMQHNDLKELDKNLLEWHKLKILDIRGNAWNCECKMISLLIKLYSKLQQINSNLAHPIYCATPMEMANKTFEESHINISHLECDKIDNSYPIQMETILIGTLIGGLLTIILIFIVRIIYRRGCFGLLGYPGPGDYNRAFYRRTNDNISG